MIFERRQAKLLAFGLLPSVPPPRAGAIASAGRVALGPRMATEVNPSIAAATPCAFPWWSDECSALIAELDAKGGERFVASHDEEGYDTRNWLHVTSSSPLRRAQYEMRYCAEEQQLCGMSSSGARHSFPQTSKSSPILRPSDVWMYRM